MDADVDPDEPERGRAPMLAASLHAELVRRGATIATAESLTGGGLGELLSSVPGASETYVGGVISYATRVKVDVVGVPAETVHRHGVVSAECAVAMAVGVRALLGSDFAVSTTGVAGPTSQDDKPVGLVYVGLAGPTGCRAVELRLDGSRDDIRRRTCSEAAAAALAMVVAGAT